MPATRTDATDSLAPARAAWRNVDAAEPPETVLDHGLLATSCFSETADREYSAKLLRQLLGLFSSERAFLFAVTSDAEGHLELGDCLASLDVDGDEVSGAQRKAPTDLALRCARERMPCGRRLADPCADDERPRSILALPACCRDRTHCVVVLENRFQDLEIESDALATALIYCRSLAGYRDLSRTVAENQSLWKDLNRLRDETVATLRVSSKTPGPRAINAPRREGLKGDYSMIIGASSRIFDILQVIDRISGSTAPVLINGESGTGKELAALAVHRNSPRRDAAFVSENCGAITETLLESELFGYVRGAFTGANKDHKGLFELATGGTLFLDEVGDMSLAMQKKLLRVLQEGVIRRVGAKDFTPVEVRIVSATNKDLLEECRRGNFREDLYYRLNVINLVLPPLRERREDVPDLVEYFLCEAAATPQEAKRIDAAALQLLVQYAWPGNIRELQNEVRKMAALCDGERLTVRDVSDHLRRGEAASPVGPDWTASFAHLTLKEAIEQLERALIRHALDSSGGNKSLVAKTLQIPKTSLYNKIHRYKL